MPDVKTMTDILNEEFSGAFIKDLREKENLTDDAISREIHDLLGLISPEIKEDLKKVEVMIEPAPSVKVFLVKVV